MQTSSPSKSNYKFKQLFSFTTTILNHNKSPLITVFPTDTTQTTPKKSSTQSPASALEPNLLDGYRPGLELGKSRGYPRRRKSNGRTKAETAIRPLAHRSRRLPGSRNAAVPAQPPAARGKSAGSFSGGAYRADRASRLPLGFIAPGEAHRRPRGGSRGRFRMLSAGDFPGGSRPSRSDARRRLAGGWATRHSAEMKIRVGRGDGIRKGSRGLEV